MTIYQKLAKNRRLKAQVRKLLTKTFREAYAQNKPDETMLATCIEQLMSDPFAIRILEEAVLVVEKDQ